MFTTGCGIVERVNDVPGVDLCRSNSPQAAKDSKEEIKV